MLTKPKYFLIFSMIAVLLVIAAQCGVEPIAESPAVKVEDHANELEATVLTPVTLGDGEQLKVVATTSIVGDIVSQVGGDKIDLTVLLPIGADTHTFEPTPRDLARIADAHVVFANGMGLEGFLDGMLVNAGGEAVVAPISAGVEPRQFEEKATEEEADSHAGEPEDHDHEGADPHTWTSPVNAIVFVHNIKQTLSALDPANAATYQARAAAYAAELEELDQWVKAQIETIPVENRELVTDHTAFGYFADRYGLQQIGAVIPSFSTAAEPSAKDLAELEDAIKQYGVKAVFVGASVNPALSERVAQDTGAALLILYTGSLGAPGSGVESYIDYIKYNTNTIVNGLD